MKIHADPITVNCRKVLAGLQLMGAPYELVHVDYFKGEQKSAAYLAINPNASIPSMVDGDLVLWESNAILRYLFAKYGKNPAFPDDLAARARADAWNEWYNLTFWANVRPLLVQLVRTPEDQRDRALIESSQANVIAALGILEGTLAKQPYVAGEHFSFGDIPLAAAAQRWFNLPLRRPATKAVEAWYARIKERPAFKKWIDLPLT